MERVEARSESLHEVVHSLVELNLCYPVVLILPGKTDFDLHLVGVLLRQLVLGPKLDIQELQLPSFFFTQKLPNFPLPLLVL